MNIPDLLSQIAEAKATLLMEIDELEAQIAYKMDQLKELDPEFYRFRPDSNLDQRAKETQVPVVPKVMPQVPAPDYPVCSACGGRMEYTVQTLGNDKTYNALVCTECNNEKLA